jgi:hypothetical protein
VRATYTNNVAAATGTLGGPATLALTGSATGSGPMLSLTLHNVRFVATARNWSISAYLEAELHLKNVGTSAAAITSYNLSSTIIEEA